MTIAARNIHTESNQDQNHTPETAMSSPGSEPHSKIFKNTQLVHLSCDPSKPSRGRGLFVKNQATSKIKPGPKPTPLSSILHT
jgi:hypothetical protein